MEEEEVREELRAAVERIYTRRGPEQMMKDRETMAQHLLDDQYLSKMTDVTKAETPLFGYALWFARHWHWEDLMESVRELHRLRISIGRKGREDIKSLDSRTIEIRSSSREPRKQFGGWPFK